MALRPEATEPAVDDLKRRARRRLVGAIVLALAAAVVLPMLLESDPKPLGDEVSVRIPPVDNSKFVNPLSPDRGPDAAVPDAKTPRKSITDAERRALGQPVPSTPKAAAVSAAPAQSAAAPTPDGAAKGDAAVKPQAAAPLPAPATDPSPAKVDAEPPKGEPAKTEPAKAEVPKADAAKSDTTKTAAPTPAPAKSSVATAKPDVVPGPGAFVVQVGAFVDTKAASDLAAQVKSSGFTTYTEGVPTTNGTVRRVRVGPFATRAEADAALAKLKAAGYDRALVTQTK